MASKNKYIGCFLGLAIGDAFGAPFEGGFIERLLWKVIGKTKDGKQRYTDDTQMSIDLANSFIKNNDINQEHLSKTFASSYKWSRGYGPSAGKILKKIKNGSSWREVNRLKYKEGSLGNGAAMRAPILALCYPDNFSSLQKNVIKASEITHAHPLAIEGAQLIAFVTYSMLNGVPIKSILETLPHHCHSALYQSKVATCITFIESTNKIQSKDIKRKLGNGIIATESCVTAIYFSLKYIESALDVMLDKIFELGGDTDTIGAMAGGIWGAWNGCDKMSNKKLRIENYVKILALAKNLHDIVRK